MIYIQTLDALTKKRRRLELDRVENPEQDIGTDINYINEKDECRIVQCKNYTKHIQIEDISGFTYILSEHSDKIG